MKKDNYIKYYLIINDKDFNRKDIFQTIKYLFENGITCCQIRIKSKPWCFCLKNIWKLKKLAKKYNVIFIVNDYILLSILTNSDGIHLGQQNKFFIHMWKKIQPKKILGISVSNNTELNYAIKINPNYLGIGAIYHSQTKPDANIFNDYNYLKNISIPYLFIGGLNDTNIKSLSKYNYSGLAYSSFLLNNPISIIKIKKISK